jgi:small-conductance mechanosensitive channel
MDNSSFDHVSEFFKLFEFKKIILLVAGFFIMGVVSNYINKMSDGLQKKFISKRLIVLKITTVITFSFYIFGSISLFYSVLRPPKELLLAVGGSAAVAIGFALKDIVSSIMAGLILLFDRPFQVGDRVSFGDTYGEIAKIGLRAVRLITLDDNLVTIPNSKFVTEVVASGNAGALDMMIVVNFNLAIESDLRLARQVMNEVVATSRYTYLKKAITIVFDEINQSEIFWIQMKVKAYVLDVRYEKAFQSDLILRGNEALRENDILRPVKDLRTHGQVLS